MDAASLTVLFLPESAYGPTNNCIGVADVLRQRGHRIVFAAESSWQGRLETLGFEEALFDLAPPTEAEQEPGAFWKAFMRDTAPEFAKETIDQLTTVVQPTYEALIDGARYCEPRLRSILAETRPDVVVEDNVVAFPALLTCGARYVRVVSCNPLELAGQQVPPTFSGLPAAEPGAWGEFRTEFDRVHRPVWEQFDSWVRQQGAPPLPELEFVHSSAELNLYVFPEILDYTDARPLDTSWHRLDSSVRETEAEFELPGHQRDRPAGSALIYLSLGSLGSTDVDLMRRLVQVLGRTPHHFIVSKGPQHDRLELAENMWGEEFLPQTSIIPLVDLVITHGGNNTVTETLHFGKPMVVLPLFWDQYDNAQRVDECGFGVRLPTYSFTDQQMHEALESLLGDDALQRRLERVSREIRARDGLTRAADLIEGLGPRQDW